MLTKLLGGIATAAGTLVKLVADYGFPAAGVALLATGVGLAAGLGEGLSVGGAAVLVYDYLDSRP